MSFFNTLTSRLDDLNLGGSKKADDGYSDRPPQNYSSRDYGYSNNGPPPAQGGYSGGGQYQSPPPPQQHYSSPPPPQDQYQSGAPQPSSSGPTYTPPAGRPPIPGGWTPQYDQQYQRWYYYEHATSRSQWEAPGYQHHASGDPRGHDAPLGGYQGGGQFYGQAGPSGPQSYDHDRGNNPYGESGKKKSSSSGMLLAGAGGLAAGAIGGALLANALADDSSDEEHHHHHHHYAAPAAAPVYEPAYNAEGEYVDASDRESVASARERYEEAYREAQDSDASSSEQEELEEAREEYYEEYEEAYEDD